MEIGVVPNHTAIIGKTQGYRGLPIRREFVTCLVNGPLTPSIVTAWLPTPKELEALNAGAAVHVRVIGTGQPPMVVEVGEPPE